MFDTSDNPASHATHRLGPPGGIGEGITTSVRQALSALRRRSQGFAWFVLGVGVAMQLLLVLVAATRPNMLRTRFVSEIRILSFVGALISIAAFLTPGGRSFRAVMAVRLLVTAALVGATRNADVLVHFMVLLPVLMELATYEYLAAAIVGDSVITGVYVLFLWLYSTLDPLSILLGGIGCSLVAAFSGLIKHYREAVVDYSKRVANLQGAFEQLTDSNLGLQIYATNAENESATKERTRITRELHDSVGYALTNIAMMMKASQVLLDNDSDKLRSMLVQAQELANDALGEARSILFKLRKVNDQSYQGLWAISRLVKAYRLATGVDVEVHYGNLEWSLGRNIDAAVYRLVQEGLTNAYRHGGATRVRITMWMSDEETVIQIWDNGRGAPVVHAGIGLAGMKERFAEYGGSVEAGNTVDGFEVKGRIPWKRGESQR